MKAAKPIIQPINRMFISREYRLNRELSDIGKVNNVLVLAPHMDDETIGLGGTIRAHSDNGTHVHCVMVTDGSNSVTEMAKEELSRKRKEEMARIQSIIGIDDLKYLNLPDGQVKSEPEAVQKLAVWMDEIKPDIIYCPPLVDAHPDHIATTAILVDALKQSEGEYVIRQYEVNCPIPPKEINVVIDVTNAMTKKIEAIEQFQSQVIAFDGFIDMNAYKSALIKHSGVKYVETFLEVPARQFIAKFDALRDISPDYPKWFKQVNRSITLVWAFYQNYSKKKELYKKT